MEFRRDNSENEILTISWPDAYGNDRQVLCVSCSIRPERSININVDNLTQDPIPPEGYGEISEGVSAFIMEQLQKAAETGIPVCAPSKE